MWEFDSFGCCIGLFGLGLLAVVVAYAVAVVSGRIDNDCEQKK